MVELLLDIGADSTVRLARGTTLSHFAWNGDAPFVVLLHILSSNESTWHMRSPENGLTILFTLSRNRTISAVHIHKILSITHCMVLKDRDNNVRFSVASFRKQCSYKISKFFAIFEKQ